MQDIQWQITQEVLEELNQTNGNNIRTLNIHQVIHWQSGLQPTLRRLHVLTSFNLVKTALSPIPLTAILRLCPRLQHVNLFLCVEAQLGQDLLGGSSVLEVSVRFPLKSLTIREMTVVKTELAAVLACCPYLQQLHLIQLRNLSSDGSNTSNSSSLRSDSTVAFNDMQFYQQVVGLCPRIDSLQLSRSTGSRDQTLTRDEFVEKKMVLFPIGDKLEFP